MLSFTVYCINFLNISAIDAGFCMVFRNAWTVLSSKRNSSNFSLFHSTKRFSSGSWWFFDLEGFCSNTFDISITALNHILFNGQSLIHSFKCLVMSLVYLFPHKPQDIKKRLSCKKQLYRNLCWWCLRRWYCLIATKDIQLFWKLL